MRRSYAGALSRRFHARCAAAIAATRTAPATTPTSALASSGARASRPPPMPGQSRRGVREARRPQWRSDGNAVREDAAADQEHRGGARHRQQLHEPRRRAQDAARRARAAIARTTRRRRSRGAQVQAGVVELHDAGDEPVDADGHQRSRSPTSTATWVAKRRVGHDAERDHDDLGGEDEVGAHRALDLRLLERDEVDRRIGEPPARAPRARRLALVARTAGSGARASRSPS